MDITTTDEGGVFVGVAPGLDGICITGMDRTGGEGVGREEEGGGGGLMTSSLRDRLNDFLKCRLLLRNMSANLIRIDTYMYIIMIF